MELIYRADLTYSQQKAMFEYLDVPKGIRHYNPACVAEQLKKAVWNLLYRSFRDPLVQQTLENLVDGAPIRFDAQAERVDALLNAAAQGIGGNAHTARSQVFRCALRRHSQNDLHKGSSSLTAV